MSFFPVFLILVLGASALSYLAKKPFGLTIPMTNAAFVFVLYATGLFRRLDVGVYLFFALIAAAVVACAVIVVRKRDGKNLLSVFKNPVFAFYVAVGIAIGVVFLYKVPSAWDEFTHWAIVTKNMFAYDDFGNLGDTTTMFNRYVPATGIFMYGFQIFNPEFVDGNMFAAFDVLAISCVLPLSERIKRKLSVGFFLSLLLPIGILVLGKTSFFFSLLVDALLGAMGAYIYFCYIAERGKTDAFTWVGVALGVFTLVSAKSSGLPIACYALALIVLDALVRGRKAIRLFFNNKWNILWVVLPILMIVYAKVSWSVYAKVNTLRAGWNASELTFGSLIEYLKRPNEFQRTVTERFLWLFFVRAPFYGNASSLHRPIWLVLPVYAACAVAVCLKRREAAFGLTVFAATTIMIFAYMISNLILFVFSFTYDESLRMLSYERYMNTVFTATTLFWLAVLIDAFCAEKERKGEREGKRVSAAWWALPAGVLACVVTIGSLLGCAYFRKKTETQLAPYREWIAVCETLRDVDRVYYAMRNPVATAYLQVRYIATPTRCSGYKDGGNYLEGRAGNAFTGDPFDMKTVTLEALREHLREYDYFFVDDADEAFCDKYGALFEGAPRSKVLYAVRKNGAGDVTKLVPANE